MNRNNLFLFTVVIAITGSFPIHAQKLPENYYTAVAVADSLFENGKEIEKKLERSLPGN